MTSQHSHLSHPKYRPDIDGLRAIAVLSVVAFHAFPSSFAGGFVGVDVFFVISGFLISTIIFDNLDKSTFRFSEFYARRIKRIFPALLLILISSYLFGWYVLLAEEYKQLGKHIAGAAGFVSNFVFWNEAGYFDNSADTKPLIHMWSLGVEEQFYIIWPFLVWFAWKQKFNILTITILVASISFILNIRGFDEDAVATFYSPQTRFWELLFGSLLAWLILYNNEAFDAVKLNLDRWSARLLYPKALPQNKKIVSNLLSIVGIFLLLFAFWRIDKDIGFPGWWAAVPVLGAVLLILAGPEASINRTILSHKLAVWFGLISYPLYLWHWPLLSFARIVESEVPNAKIRIAAVALSILLAGFTYSFVERKFRMGGHSTLKVTMLSVLMIIIGCIGYNTYIMDGYEFRSSIAQFNKNMNELVEQDNTDNQCIRYVGVTPLFDFCRFTNVGADETIAVVGDSHAHVAYPGISEFWKERGKNTLLLANAGCPPYLGVLTGKNDIEINECKRKQEQILALLLDREEISDIYLLTRWTVYVTATEPLQGEKKLTEIEFTDTELVKGAQKSIDILVEAGKKVFFVTENPELRFESESCVPRPLRLTTKDCRPIKSHVIERFKEYLDSVETLERVKLINSLDFFCPNDRCIVFDEEGNLLYLDDDHLSVSGSRFQAENLFADTVE